MKTYQVNKEGYYGEFGGAYIPEILHRCVEELQNAYSKVLESEGFKQEFHQLLRDYVGRPSPLYLANRLSKKYGCKIYGQTVNFVLCRKNDKGSWRCKDLFET